MASAREMRLRIKSVKNISQVTRALEAVSAAKVRKAIQALSATRSYATKAWQVLRHITGQPGGVNLHPLLTARANPKNALVVVMTADRGLAVVRLLAGEDEVIVRDRRLPREDRVAPGNLVEGVDRERGGPVGRGQQVGVDAQCRSGRDLRVLVHAVRPHDLLRGREPPGALGIRPRDLRTGLDRPPELAAADREDAAAPTDLLLLGGER